MGGPPVPPDQMSPRTRGPRTSCPPGRVVLGQDDPRQDRMSPTPFNSRKEFWHLRFCWLCERCRTRDMGLTAIEYDQLNEYAAFHRYPTGSSKNQRRIIRRRCLENFRAEDGVLYYSQLASDSPDRKWKIVVRSEEERRRIMESCHSSPHGRCCMVGILLYYI